jgi:hypothetical protein
VDTAVTSDTKLQIHLYVVRIILPERGSDLSGLQLIYYPVRPGPDRDFKSYPAYLLLHREVLILPLMPIHTRFASQFHDTHAIM